MTIWFAGCMHFDGEKVRKLANRPFDNVDDMNKQMIENWNRLVRPDDHAYILGDICHTSSQNPDANIEFWLNQLNGKHTIVWGNHDEKEQWPESVVAAADYMELEEKGQKIVLFHYPIEDWNGRWTNSIHIHAHDHVPEICNAAIPEQGDSGLALGDRFDRTIKCNRFRVGFDATNFEPISLNQILSMVR